MNEAQKLLTEASAIEPNFTKAALNAIQAALDRRITPPTDTTGSGREGETDAIRAQAIQTATDIWNGVNKALEVRDEVKRPCFRETMRDKIANALEIAMRLVVEREVEALRRDGERLQWLLDIIAEHGTDGLQSFPWSILNDPANDPDEDDPDRLTPILDRAAIDSAQRQEGSKADYSAANPHEC